MDPKGLGRLPSGSEVVIQLGRKLPDLLQSVKLKYVKLGYHYLIIHVMYLLIVPFCLVTFIEIGRLGQKDIGSCWKSLQYNLVNMLFCSGALVCCATLYFMSRPRPVYLIDFACYKPGDERKCPTEVFLDCSKRTGVFTDSSLDFQRKIAERSGLGQETYLPPVVFSDKPNPSMDQARQEAEMVMFGALDELFAKTGLRAKEIGILIVNCSLFVPTPSLSAMIVNHYEMRGNILTYNLGGMGCSAGVIAIDLAKDLLRVHRNSYALVVSMENITLNWYFGNSKSMLVSNCIFRMGGAAILLSNKHSEKSRAKYNLVHTVRTHKGAEDKSYQCVYQEEDDDHNIGVALSKDLMAMAGDALKTNITTLGPIILPLSEQILFFATLVARKLLKMKLKPYIPDFKQAVEHFCIHAGGRAVLDAMEKNLNLTSWHMEPARMTLHRFGNTSSSTLWYELAYTEAKGRVQKGDRVWQIAFGSGFKCNSAVWMALRYIPPPAQSPWSDCIHGYPTFQSSAFEQQLASVSS
ncbi:hypothetical protein O6H91_03G086900 [Diphasiastrum complanatum]|nr:hypothetical protein O6H91_03G086900 [Diphasiastrum complanatum]